jgi:hypothetical protein
MSADDTNEDRRPPALSEDEEAIGASDGWADGAIISPDDPIVRTGPVAVPDDFEKVMEKGAVEDVVVTGIGTDRAAAGPDGEPIDPYVARVVRELAVLASGLRRRGEVALRVEPDMTRFETTLRGYCVGVPVAQMDRAAAS